MDNNNGIAGPRYIGIKYVNAEPMKAEVAIEKGYRVINEPDEDGYEVLYEGGYKSWCPKNVFEMNNYEIKNWTLAETCRMMMSKDYVMRMQAEYLQLKNRVEGLANMLQKWDKGELSFTPTCPRELLEGQLEDMRNYLDKLEKRRTIEKVTERLKDR